MTEAELNTLIEQYEAARTLILAGGQSYSIGSGGSTRTVTQADLGLIETNLRIYRQELSELLGNTGFVARAGW